MTAARLSRRRALAGVAAALAAGIPFVRPAATKSETTTMTGTPSARSAEAWNAFKAAFIAPNDYVLDRGDPAKPDPKAHSEGQSYAMLFAVAHDDRATFDRIWRWTDANMRRADDRLFGWCWKPAKRTLTDDNVASDGDVGIAWALTRASSRWKDAAYAAAAREIAGDVLRKLVVEAGGRTVLKAGLRGHENPNGTPQLNLSYWMFPAFRELDALVPSPKWQALVDSGLELLRRARFGAFRLPSDWISLDANGDPFIHADDAPNKRPRFGYDAIRIPLYLAWGGHAGELGPFAAWGAAKPNAKWTPAWVDLTTGAMADYEAPAGHRAVLDMAAALDAGKPPAVDPRAAFAAPGPDYYSASLTLLASLAADALRARHP